MALIQYGYTALLSGTMPRSGIAVQRLFLHRIELGNKVDGHIRLAGFTPRLCLFGLDEFAARMRPTAQVGDRGLCHHCPAGLIRKQTFHTLAALNLSIRSLLDDLNRRPFKKRPGSRLTQFEQLDKPALNPLPGSPYEYRHIKKARVHLDYHIEYENHYYSVPYQLVKEEVMVHAGQTVLAIFYQGKQVALHPRSYYQGGHTTDPRHMAKSHQKHQEWSPQRFLSWAASIGPNTQTVIQHQLASRRHPEHGYRACLGLLSLTKKYGKERLEAACRRAQQIGGMNYKSIASILSNSLDKVPLEHTEKPSKTTLPLMHENVRGADYYH